MLSILTLAYAGKTIEELVMTGTAEIRRRHVFETYVHRMLQRRGSQRHYTHEQTMHWLTWLAQRLTQQNQTEFYLERMQPSWLPSKRIYPAYNMTMGIIIGLLFGLALGVIVGLFGGLLAGGLMGLAFSGLFGRKQQKIQPIEAIRWSQEEMKGALFGGLFGGLFFALLLGMGKSLLIGLLSGLFFGIFCSMLWLLKASLHLLDTHDIVTPNQGTWRSLRNGLLFGLIVGASYALLSGVYPGLNAAPFTGLLAGLFGGLSIGILIGLFFGGIAYIQHFVLRWFLRSTGAMPWNYVRFLDYAADHLLLRKVGGGYIFIHRLLLEYFVSLPLPQSLVNDTQTQPAAPAQGEPATPVDDVES